MFLKEKVQCLKSAIYVVFFVSILPLELPPLGTSFKTGGGGARGALLILLSSLRFFSLCDAFGGQVGERKEGRREGREKNRK